MISVLKYSFLLIFIGLTGCSSSPQKSHQAPPLEIVDPVVPPKENKQPKKTKSVVVQAQTVAQEHKKTYLPTGKLAYITTYKNNVKVSKESFTYYKTGELSIQSKSIQGLKHGLVKHYSKNGNIWRTEQYQKGKKHGFSISYYTPVIIAKKLHFNNGLSDGVQEAFLPNGKRSDKWLYEQGKLLSHFKFQYFESGNLQFQHTYRNNQKNGLSNEYSEDGVLLSSSNFKNNLHHGKTLQFYETGKIKVEQRFRDNKEHGGSSGYYPLGELQWQTAIIKMVYAKVYTKNITSMASLRNRSLTSMTNKMGLSVSFMKMVF